jgi:hypothetical protein
MQKMQQALPIYRSHFSPGLRVNSRLQKIHPVQLEPNGASGLHINNPNVIIGLLV